MRAPVLVMVAVLGVAACSEAPGMPTADAPGVDAPVLDAAVDAGARPDVPTTFDAPPLVDAPDAGPVSCADPDVDGDGADSMACGGLDCDDANPDVQPGAPELCDALDLDEDCDPTTFGDRDRDGDGFVDAACCNTGATTRCGDDCDDLRRAVTPISSEVCDRFDNDCDGAIDETVAVAGFVDADRDLHGDGAMAATGCAGEPGFSPVGDDCDDTDPLTHGAQREVCNGLDDDCDGNADEGAGAIDWWPDADLDGFGDPDGTPISSCTPVPDHRLLATDCDDSDPARNPGATEICDGADQDCDGQSDFEVAPGDLEDDDRDGYPDAACATGARADCDDRDPTVRPGAAEIADGIDNDCDGTIDATCEMTSWWLDADGDGFGDDATAMIRACDPPAGRVTRAGDCDDTDGDRNPAMRDVCNGVDDDCDGEIDGDAARYCVVRRALPVCTAGVCEIGLCERHYDDCVSGTGPSMEGCETDTRVSALHCGMCGIRCPSGPRSLPVCAAATCGLTCTSGYANCDAMTATGCEVDTRFDELNCGACLRPCSARPNATPLCTDGTCGIACNPGFADCDGMLGNGCEVDASRDTANCGGCGMACPIAGDVCVRSACTAPAYPSDASEGNFAPTGAVVTISAGRHDYASVFIPAGTTVRVGGNGRLDLRATGEIVIEGVLDLGGGAGGNGIGSGCPGEQGGGGGGATGTAADGAVGTGGCPGARSTGGSGMMGGDTSIGCGLGGAFGGGNGSGWNTSGGGGGGGYAGGAGGAGPVVGTPGVGASVMGLGVGGTGSGGGGDAGLRTMMLAAYAGADSDGRGGGGGSIGYGAAMDLAVADRTFNPGSGGGGGGPGGGCCCAVAGGGGGGGGGALRLSSLVRILISGSILVDGGSGGASGSSNAGGGGGGSGGVIYLAAPEVRITSGTLNAVGGAGGALLGGAGGLGRIRLSTLPELCSVSGTFTPAFETPGVCAATPGAGMPARVYVGVYPN